MLQGLTIRRQLGLAFALVIGIFVLVGLAVGSFVLQLQQGARQFERETLPHVLTVDEMALSVEKVQQFLTDVGATHDPAAYAEADEAAKAFGAGLDHFKALATQRGDSAQTQALATLRQRFDAFHDTGRRMAQAYIDQGLEAGNKLMKGDGSEVGFDQRSEDLIKDLEPFRAAWLGDAREQATQATLLAQRVLWMLAAGTLVAAMLSLLFAAHITRSVYRLLGGEPTAAAQLARDVGDGNLTPTELPARAEPGSLMHQLHAMQHALAGVVAQVRASSHGVADASARIVSGNGDLSQHTARQAGELQQATQAMRTLHDAVNTSASHVSEANTLADSTAQVAEHGGALVHQVVTTMGSIREASQKIADIIGVVDSIAFQTNILALNAAVEAARAGEQGRGFAVVAGEVRTLASRTAAAAREVKQLIGSNVERVAGGTQLVEQTGATITEVVQGIRRLRELMERIHAASAEQVDDMAQVSASIQQIDSDTQHNTALVQHMASASTSLDAQASALVDSVRLFQVQPA